ncbi:MAG: AI-2E family transporter [Halopseudomonas sp.]
MQADESQPHKILSKELTDVLIRVGVVAILVYWCLVVVGPFVGVLLWALILAMTLYPLHQRLANRIGGAQGRAATLVVLSGWLLIGLPIVLLGSSFASQVHEVHAAFSNNTVSVNPPASSVADWPLVGEKVYQLWSDAAQDLPALLERLQPQLGNLSKALLSQAASTAGSVALFLVSLAIAGVMMAYGESGSRAMLRILRRLAGEEKGASMHRLSTATTRSVATGVLGVALIQAVLLGIGFIWGGVPAAGVLAVIALVLGIAQVPALVVSIPAIGYIWWSSGDASLHNILVTIYLLVATLADNVLKPMLLGRGVDAPMPIILMGAIGGMISAGIIGLFVGAVVLAVGYQLFMAWTAEVDAPANAPTVPAGNEQTPKAS